MYQLNNQTEGLGAQVYFGDQLSSATTRSLIPIHIPQTASMMLAYLVGAGGQGGNGGNTSASGNWSGGAGGGAGGRIIWIVPTLLLPKTIYLVMGVPNADTTLVFERTLTPTNTGIFLQCTSGSLGGAGVSTGNSSGGTNGFGNSAGCGPIGFTHGVSGQAGQNGIQGANGLPATYNSTSLLMGGPSGGGMSSTSEFTGGGVTSTIWFNGIANTAAEAAGTSGYIVRSATSTSPFLGSPGTAGGSTNGGTGGAGSLYSGSGCGGPGGGSGSAGGGAGQKGGESLAIIQFW